MSDFNDFIQIGLWRREIKWRTELTRVLTDIEVLFVDVLVWRPLDVFRLPVSIILLLIWIPVN
jgi:hypothetical protein